MATARALHFVFKVGNRTDTAKFYRDVLGMKFLRHEEFDEGCKAACNGGKTASPIVGHCHRTKLEYMKRIIGTRDCSPYDGKWSKSMVGYGPEDNHFVIELTYNYGIGSYRLGDDFRGITISSPEVLERAKKANYPVTEENGVSVLQSPDGYKFFVVPEKVSGDPVQKVSLSCSNLSKSVEYWNELCGMDVFSKEDKTALLGFGNDQCKLELVDIGQEVDHATASGRVAFACPRKQLPEIQKRMEAAGQKILTPLLSLDTPGKATVEVVILSDPDGHEICFVGGEAFKELSQVDPKADELLDEAIKNDKSDDWFAKKGLQKGVA